MYVGIQVFKLYVVLYFSKFGCFSTVFNSVVVIRFKFFTIDYIIMHYDIELPREVSGTELMDALKEVASKLRWRYKKAPISSDVHHGSVEIERRSFRVELKTFIFLGRMGYTNPYIDPNGSYSTLGIDSSLFFPFLDEDATKLTEALYDVLPTETQS